MITKIPPYRRGERPVLAPKPTNRPKAHDPSAQVLVARYLKEHKPGSATYGESTTTLYAKTKREAQRAAQAEVEQTWKRITPVRALTPTERRSVARGAAANAMRKKL